MRLAFTKMHGLGNDFVVIDAIRQDMALTPAQVHFLADRHRGIGCDQLLLVERSTRPEVDFRYRIYNQDGGEVEQCGNGARCFVRFVIDQGLTSRHEIAVETASGIIYPRLEADGQVSVNMGSPRFNPADIPFVAERLAPRYALEFAGRQIEIGAVSMGNPHAVLAVTDVATAPVAEWGPLLESHPRFPRRVNVGFMQVIDRQHLALRVFERGAGETQACGSGACAAVAVAQSWGLVDDDVRVELRGGALRIRWAGTDAPVWMTGPAVSVFDGVIDL